VHVLPFVCKGWIRVARADVTLGRKPQALELLERSLQGAGRIPVPPAGQGAGESDWGGPGPVLTDRCGIKAQVAAALEQAGEADKGGAALASALSDLAAIPGAKWRGYAWREIALAYAGEGRPGRAVEILSAHAADAQEQKIALEEIPAGELFAAPRDRVWALLDALPAGELKVGLLAQLAAQAEKAGHPGEAKRFVAAALAAIATRGEDWELWLVSLANELPDPDQPGYEELLPPLLGEATLSAAVATS
jgi:hypothetical protein